MEVTMNQPDPTLGQWVRDDSGAWVLADPSTTWTEGLATVNLTGLPIPDLPADPDLIPPDPTQLRSPR